MAPLFLGPWQCGNLTERGTVEESVTLLVTDKKQEEYSKESGPR